MKKSKIFITIIMILCFALSIMPIKVFASTEIGDVDIEGVTFNYNPGDAPKATAYKCDPWDELYDIEYEYWEEMETDASGNSVPVKYWYSDESKNNALSADKKITTFEEGKTYMYSVSLKARDGNTFASNSSAMVNNSKVNSINVINSGTRLFIVAVKTIKTVTIQLQHISTVEINNATISFKVGDKPVFTGKIPENVPYIYQCEFWETDGGNKAYNSSDFFNNNNPDKLFNTFESGKTYTYGIYLKSEEGYCFTRDTKLKINGKDYNYRELDWESQPNVSEFATMWVNTDLTMTPTENLQENPVTPSEPEKPAENPSNEPVTPTKPTQEPEKEPQTTENNQNNNEINNPKTGDNIITSVVLFVTSIATIGVLTIVKRKKARK